MKRILSILFVALFSVPITADGKPTGARVLEELNDIVTRKDVKRLEAHLSTGNIEMIATSAPEIWSKEKMMEFLESADDNAIKTYFFVDLVREIARKVLDTTESPGKDAWTYDSNLRGSGLQLKIKLKGSDWFITGIGYL